MPDPDTRIDAVPGRAYRCYDGATLAEARAAFAARYGELPAECWQDGAGIVHAGPIQEAERE